MRGAVMHGPGEVRATQAWPRSRSSPTAFAHSIVEAAGTQQSMNQALHATGYRAIDQRDAIKTLLRP